MCKKRRATYGERMLAFLILGLSLLAGASGADPQSELVRAHSAFHQALREADASALDRLLDEHFTWTHTDGLVQSKADLLEKVRGGLRYPELSAEQETFNEYAKAAVLSGRSR